MVRKLESGMILYHGSFCQIETIDLSHCLKGKDFGHGFYLTTSYQQAERFVKLSVKNAARLGLISEQTKPGYVNSYVLKDINNINEFDFLDADVSWLHFVSSNRDKGFFQTYIKDFEKYNVIGGKIANDKTAATLNQYLNGTFGLPGDETADNIAIQLLLPNRLEDQYCFRNQLAIDSLQYQHFEKVFL